jgi:isopentenyl-diphosphate delta-isomerase type 1
MKKLKDGHYHESSTDLDLLPVVDADDRTIGKETRREVHLQKKLHRSVHVVVVNGRGEVLLQHRSAKKDRFPGWWDISVGGHVDVGEGYDEAADREIFEELGIKAPLTAILRREADKDTGFEFVWIYECQYQGDVMPNRDEVDEVRWVSLDELMVQGHSDGKGDPYWRVTSSGLGSIWVWAWETKRLKS